MFGVNPRKSCKSRAETTLCPLFPWQGFSALFLPQTRPCIPALVIPLEERIMKSVMIAAATLAATSAASATLTNWAVTSTAVSSGGYNLIR